MGVFVPGFTAAWASSTCSARRCGAGPRPAGVVGPARARPLRLGRSSVRHHRADRPRPRLRTWVAVFPTTADDHWVRTARLRGVVIAAIALVVVRASRDVSDR